MTIAIMLHGAGQDRFRLMIAITLAISVLSGRVGSADTGEWQQRIAAAKAGQIVELPAGEIKGSFTLPPGVGLKGAGYGRTVIDASGGTNGITVAGSGAVVSDLTVRGATSTGILVRDATNVTLSRVRATGGAIGISVQGTRGARVENCVSDGNRYGIIVAGGEGNTVVNCTAADNVSLGFSFPSGAGTVAFNNVSTGSTVAVNVGEGVRDIVLDYNLLLGLNIGKCGRVAQRQSLNDWQYVSGRDLHSVSIPVKFADAASGRYAVTNALDWSLDRTVTAGWGARKLAGRAAPATDIDGASRPGAPGVGAFETRASAPRPADGSFMVPDGAGLVSAGVFDARGKLVSYFFQTLPLPAGRHRFWLPARSFSGQPIAAGNYEVRVVRGDLHWKYVGWFGNSARKDAQGFGSPCNHMGFAMDDAGRLFVGNAPADVFANIRGADGATGQWLWTIEGTAQVPGAGVTVGSDGLLYVLRDMQGQGMCLTRIRPATGQVELAGSQGGQIPLKDGAALTGVAALGDRLCYTATTKNAVLFGTIADPTPGHAVTVPAPAHPTADAKTGVVWVISQNEKLVAVSPDGAVVATVQPVGRPLALAARGGLLAVAAADTGKVHIFDASEPATLKPLRTIGRGDGPEGRILSDRFLFQGKPVSTDLALGPHGEIAVGDFFRIQMFEPDGRLRWTSWGIWGGGSVPSRVTPGRIYDGFGFTYMADGVTGQWQPESYHPLLAGRVVADCRIGGQDFVLQGDGNGQTFVRFTPERAAQVLKLEATGGHRWRRDSNGDGRIDASDAATPVADSAGKPVEKISLLHHMFNVVQPDGTITNTQRPDHTSWLLRWPTAGLDAQGVPIYRWEDCKPLPGADKVISPYDWKPDQIGIGQFAPRPGGGWSMCTNMRSSVAYGKSPFNNGGTDVIGVAKDGSIDWVRTFGQYLHIGGFDTAQGLTIAGMATTCDFHVMNDDGLGLPGFSTGSAWLDHPEAALAFVDAAGKANVIVTDCTRSCNDWIRLERCSIRGSRTKFSVRPAAAAMLAALPAAAPDFTAGKPATMTIRVPHLKAPWPIDGDLQKWRDAGIAPQLVITPEAGAHGIDGGPADCSLLVRYAWEGRNLYVQALKFDDAVTSHNPQARANMQDTVEMAVNSYLEGIKFNFSLTSDHGPTIYADGGWQYRCNLLPAEHAPRVIKVLDSAAEISERQIVESLAGVDMRNSKVELFEARLPIDEKTYAGFEKNLWELKPGQVFWLNFLVDDNDVPGTDCMRFIEWPIGSGTFMPKENGVKAVLE